MRRVPVLALLAALVALPLASGCATIDEAYGVPEASSWSYFQGTAEEVAEAAQRRLIYDGYQIERVGQTDDGGYALTVSLRNGSADFEEILIQPYTYKMFESRAQTHPDGRRLPEGLRAAIAQEL